MKENKLKILSLIIAILLIANIVLLLLFFKKDSSAVHGKQDRKAYIATFLKTEIGFDNDQLEKFDSLSNQHQQMIENIFNKNGVKKEVQFKQLVANNFSDSSISLLADKAAATQKITNGMMFTHFKNIRLLCKPTQLATFDSLFGKVLSRHKGGDKKK
jgi:periplasmic protein CpxP/Spy